MSTLAVKYRPKTFSDVIGQDVIVEILSKQLENNDVASGYLFSGSSGIGKTTVARIVADSLNADIKEIDGASNNSVDNIRQVRSDTRLKSISSDWKVYIIDEAHMLSKGAFNALLKTLEEPPENVMFILATTEPEKIPKTIQTRLQHFKFSRLNWKDIKGRLAEIAEEENIEVEEEILDYIAKVADGGVRTAINLLEKAIQLDSVTVQVITELSGAVEYKDVFKLLATLIEGQADQLIQLIESMYEAGKNLEKFIEQCCYFTTDLAKYAMFRNFEYVKIPAVYEEDLLKLLDIVKNNDVKLRELFNQLNQLRYDLRYENDKKILIEAVLLQIGG